MKQNQLLQELTKSLGPGFSVEHELFEQKYRVIKNGRCLKTYSNGLFMETPNPTILQEVSDELTRNL